MGKSGKSVRGKAELRESKVFREGNVCGMQGKQKMGQQQQEDTQHCPTSCVQQKRKDSKNRKCPFCRGIKIPVKTNIFFYCFKLKGCKKYCDSWCISKIKTEFGVAVTKPILPAHIHHRTDSENKETWRLENLKKGQTFQTIRERSSVHLGNSFECCRPTTLISIPHMPAHIYTDNKICN